jgi:hypothetical protein
MRARGVPPSAACACGDRHTVSSPDDEGLIVDRPVDLVAPHATGLASRWVAVKGRLPGSEIVNGMFDLQDRHGNLLGTRG